MGKRTLKPAAPAPDVDLDLEEEEIDNDNDGFGHSSDDLLDDDEDDDEPTDLEGRLDRAIGGPLDDDLDFVDFDGEACKYCGCTEATPCETPDGPCSWIPGDEPVCTNDACLRKHRDAGGALPQELLADLDEAIDGEPEARARDTEIAGDGETLGSPRAEGEPIGIAENLPGRPAVMELVVDLPLDDIVPDPDQPRIDVDDELTASVEAEGVKQPIVVRRHPLGAGSSKPYMIVDGERRWTAAIAAGLDMIRARITDHADDEGERLLLQVTLNEGKRLAPMEEAKAWKRIMDAKGWKIQQLASALGRAKSTVSDRLALLDAPAAFQPLFIDGTLSAAAAPIAREYRQMPERALKQLVDAAKKDWGWRQAIEAGATIPVAQAKETLERVLLYTFPRVAENVPFDDTFELKGVRYAIDRDAYHRAADAVRRADEKASGKARSETGDAASRRIANDERLRRERAEKTRQLRRAQFHAIADRVPSTLDGKWSLLLVRYAIKEMQQLDQSIAAKALGIAISQRAGHIGHAAEKALVAHAEQLSVNGRLNFLMKLLLATDLQVSEWNGGGPAERLAAAAKLARVDLKKVKAPAKKTPAKKGARR